MLFEKNTNVIELYDMLVKGDDTIQMTWYNSGVGTYARPSWRSLQYYIQIIYHIIDMMIAWCID
jgi:uncharacterized protein (DUF2235 family)